MQRKSEVLTDSHYSLKDAYSGDVIIPFDTSDNSTLMSTDSDGMYFDVFTDDLDPGRTYAFDVLIVNKGNQQVFTDVGGVFRIEI